MDGASSSSSGGPEAGAGGPANPPPAGAAAAASSSSNAVAEHLRSLLSSVPSDLRRQHGPSGVTGLLASPASHFTAAAAAAFVVGGAGTSNGAAPEGGGGPTEEECSMYLRAVAANAGCMVECVGGQQRGAGEGVAEVVRAAGNAATRCRTRSDISKSGIIPALASIAAGFQAPPPSTSDGMSSAAAAAAAAETDPGEPMENGTASTASSSSPAPPCPVLTPAHPELLQCCLLAGQYRAASRLVASVPVRTVAYGTTAAAATGSVGGGGGAGAPPRPEAAGILNANKGAGQPSVLPGVNSETYLRYFYYLGMVRIGTDDLLGAVAAFSVCLTVPCHVVSAVTIAARKKMLLCSCLLSSSDGYGGAGGGGGGAGKVRLDEARAGMRRRLLAVPAAASPAVVRYVGAASPSFAASATGGPSSSSAASSGASKRTRGGLGGATNESDSDAPMMGAAGVDAGGSGGGERVIGRRVSATLSSGDAGTEPAPPEAAAAPPSASAPTRRDRERNYYNLGRYDQLVDAFASADVATFRAERESMASILAMDGNAGLAARCEGALRDGTVRAAADVYEVVPLGTLAREVGLTGVPGAADEAERLVVRMVSDCAGGGAGAVPLAARIDQESGMVYFNCDDGDDDDDDDDDDGDYGYGGVSARQARADLAVQMGQCVELADRIRGLDASITASGRYQAVVVRGEASAKAAGGGAGGGGGGATGGPRGVAELDRPGMFD